MTIRTIPIRDARADAPAGSKTATGFALSPIRQSHADLVARIAGASVQPIPLEPAPEDFTRRALVAELVLSAVKAHLTKLVEDVANNDPSSIMRDADLVRSIDAHLSDLAGDIAGTLNQVAERLIEDRYEGCPRGPMHRVRCV